MEAMEVVFVPSDTFQMAPPSVDRIGIALIASNLNYRREAPEGVGRRRNRLFLRGYSPRLNLREEEEDVENIQNRKAISTLHSAAATPPPWPKPSIPCIVYS